MPFTPAHPLAVLPLARTPLPLSALVAGTVVPDLPVYTQSWGGYGLTHGVVGVLLVDVVLGVAALALWFLVLRDPLVDLAPAPVRDRLPVRGRLSRDRWPLVVPAIWLGAATHVLWDELTHPGRWGSRHVAWLAEVHGPTTGAQWFQYTSGVVGTLLVLGYALWVLAARPVDRGGRGPRRLPQSLAPFAVVVALVAGAVAAAGRAPGLHAMAFHGVVTSMLTGAALVVVASAGWHLAGMKKRQRGLGG